MDDIEEIKNRIDIAEYVGRVVALSKAGRNFKGLCPFHHEKTPSFIVSPEKQIWHCFGCNEGGDVIKFLMKTDGLEFGEALRKLAEEAGIKLSQNFAPRNEKREKLFEINEKACLFFERNINQPSGKNALSYLLERGLTREIIKDFRLGFALSEAAELSMKLKKEGYTTEELGSAGVSTVREGRIIDQFRGRITFPIMNASGAVVGFSARVLGDRLPKYINTPATQIYDKSHALYGIALAKEAIRQKDYAIIVEGNMDVIASYQAGVKNVVASSGTALTEGQLDLLKRFTSNLKLAFDIDPAGNLATRRAIELAYEKGINIKIIELKEEKDAAEAVKKNPKIWLRAVRDAKYFMDYLFEKTFAGISETDVLKKKRATAEFLAVLEKAKDPVEKEHYIKKISEKLKMPEEMIRESLKTKIVKHEKKPAVVLKEDDIRQKIESRLVGTALSKNDYLEFLLTSLSSEDFTDPIVSNLYSKVKNYYNERKLFELDSFTKTLDEDEKNHLQTILLKAEIEFEKFDEEETGEEIFYLIKKIKRIILKERKQQLNREIKESEAKQDGQIEKLMAEMQELIREEQEI